MTDQQPYEPKQPHQPSPTYQPPQGSPAEPDQAPTPPAYPAPPAAQPTQPTPPAPAQPAYPGQPSAQPTSPYPGAPAAPAYPAAAPAYPVPGQPGQPGQPVHPGYQGYPAPAYGAPAYGAPAYGAPGYGAPGYGAPGAVPLGASNPDDLSLPLYGATFTQAIKRFFKKYATFSGRASRSEYWWMQLFFILVSLVPVALLVIGTVTGSAWVARQNSYSTDIFDAPGFGLAFGLFWLVGIVLWLGLLIPALAITWRRLHDANFAGPFWFLSFTYVGSLVVLVFTILPSNAMGQRFDLR